MKKYYVGMDVHLATISIAVMNEQGRIVSEAIIETKTEAIGDFIKSLRGELHVTCEEGTQAAWLFDLLRPLAAEVIVGNPRHNKLLHSGNKNDRVDARRLAELLRHGSLRAVYHGEHGTRTLKELVRCYECLVEDRTRVKNRLKAIFGARAITSKGRAFYQASQREAWLQKLEEGARDRAELLYRQLDELKLLDREARRLMLQESRRHEANKLLQQIPELGPIRVAQIIATIDTPHRFRTKRPLWAYLGLSVDTHSSADYQVRAGKVHRSRKAVQTRGLNRHYNHRLKAVFKSAATGACDTGPYKQLYDRLVESGMRAEMARLTVARKLAATVLAMWKRGESFDEEKIMKKAA
ncbi:MAG: IS110 family transposase [Pyrinomonadaceae bacterium]